MTSGKRKNPQQGTRTGAQPRSTTRPKGGLMAARAARQRQQRLMAIIGGSVAIAIVAVIALVLINQDDGGSDLPPIVTIAGPDASIPRDGMTLGSADAPIKLVEYGDYQCPACAIFADDAMDPLVADYIATGQVQFTFVPFSFLGEESNRAAEAAACAADQGKFWEMHENIYYNHEGENEGAYSDARLREIAGNVGMDLDAYDTCLREGTHEDSVTQFNQQATDAGITSTPTFKINGGDPFGYAGWDDFRARLDGALAA
ncbi:MAG: DsbA family protein [Chloroflexota bacterium]|jgi:protein-disulfide isomerase|nr:DsbA family protein [Chloroflexota bacterium]